MAEYIERKVLSEIMDDIAGDETCPMNIAEDIYYAVDCTPAADVEPVKHGHWIYNEDTLVTCKCSCCHWEGKLYEDDVSGIFYCPNCGAKMNEEEL